MVIDGAAGAIESTVKLFVALPTFPAASIEVTVTLCAPCVNVVPGDQTLVQATAVFESNLQVEVTLFVSVALNVTEGVVVVA